jgi:plasmid stabilization system protein ParE
MTLPVVMRVQARAEFDEAFDWYEQQRTGLGVQFMEQVQAVFDLISATPELRPAVYRDVRRALVGGFPYSVFYRVGTGHVIVLSVFHNKRNPAIWRSRA